MTSPAIHRSTVVGCAEPRTARPPTVDYPVALVIHGMLSFPAAMRAVSRLGFDMFPNEVYRRLAWSLATGSDLDERGLTADQRALLTETLDQTARMTIPDTLEWAIALIGYLAEREFGAILVAMLRWAADEVERGHRLDHLHRQVNHAFDIACGRAPFDPQDGLEPTP